MAADGEIAIHSYRAVFDLERRIYRVDTLRLNPAGVPLRGILYAAGLALAALALSRMGPLGWPLRALPWYARLLLVPALGGAALCVIRLEGRTFHLAVTALLRYSVSSRLLCALATPRAPAPGATWSPGELVAICDGSGPALRRLRYRGPGRVLVRVGHRYAHQSPAERLAPRPSARRLLLLPGGHPQAGITQGRRVWRAGAERPVPEVIEVGAGAQLLVVGARGR